MNNPKLLVPPAAIVEPSQKPPTFRLLLGGVSLFIVLVGLVAIAALEELESKTKSEISNTLRAVVNTTHAALNIWVNDLQHYTEQFAQDPKLIALVKEQLSAKRQPVELLETDSLIKLRALYKSKDALSGLGFFIVAPDFISIASLRDSNIGTRNLIAKQRPGIMQEIFDGKTRVVPPIESDVLLLKGNGKQATSTTTMFVGTPLRDEDGRIIAVLTIRIDPHKTFSEITKLGSTGKTNETFAVDEKGNILTTVRSNIPGAKSTSPEELPLYTQHSEGHTHSAMAEGVSVDIEGHINYLNEPVFGAWMWDKNMHIGLETEIHVSEAMQPYYQSRKIIGFMFGVTILLALVTVLSVAYISRKTNTKLQLARDQLEGKVQERTKALLAAYDEISKVKQNLVSLISSLPDAMVCVNRKGEIVRANKDAEKLFAYSAAELVGMSVDVLIPEGVRENHKKLREGYVQGNSFSRSIEKEVKARKKDGEVISVGVNINSIELDGEFITISNVRDISERKHMEAEKERLQAQLLQSEKIKTIGRLTGGIAHDFNNILAAILGYTQLCQVSLHDNDVEKQSDYLSEIYQSGMRASDLIKQMLSFSQGESSRKEIIIPSVVLDETLKIVRATIPSSIEVVARINEGDVSVVINPTRFHEAILNLVINSRDALEGKGKIEVGIKNTEISGECDSCRESISGSFVELYVQDDRAGMCPELAPKTQGVYVIPEDASNDSEESIGLAMVHGIIHESQGHILIEPSAGAGCKVRLLFPRGPALSVVPARSNKEYQLPEAVENLKRSRIMVIDDEHSLTVFLSEMLRNYGYETEGYNDSKKALQDYLANPEKYDLLITDQTMPGLTGIEIAKAISAKSPNMPIILFSGYSDQVDADSAASFGIDAYFDKPLDMPAFLEKIEMLLKKNS